MNEQMEKKIEELTSRKDFIEKLSKTTTKDEMKKLFEEENVSLNETDLDFLYSTIQKKELPDEALENVAGGSFIGTAFNVTKTVVSLGISIIGFLKNALK